MYRCGSPQTPRVMPGHGRLHTSSPTSPRTGFPSWSTNSIDCPRARTGARAGVPWPPRRLPVARGGEVVPRVALRDERADERRRDPEHRHLLLLDEPPDAVVGPVRSGPPADTG